MISNIIQLHPLNAFILACNFKFNITFYTRKKYDERVSKIFYDENTGVTHLCDVQIIHHVKSVLRQLRKKFYSNKSVCSGVRICFRKLQYANFLDKSELAKFYCRFRSLQSLCFQVSVLQSLYSATSFKFRTVPTFKIRARV
jgi:hypothetical protein